MKSSSAQDSCHFSPESGVSITHEQNLICSKTSLDGKQAITCRQLFESHVAGSVPMKRKKKYIKC